MSDTHIFSYSHLHGLGMIPYLFGLVLHQYWLVLKSLLLTNNKSIELSVDFIRMLLASMSDWVCKGVGS
jgi:hypothetical protein